MGAIKIFKAKRQTHRFRENQDVWVVADFANHAFIRFKWRGSGRYVSGTIDKWANNGKGWNPTIGPDGFKEIEVSDDFVARLKHETV